MVASLGLTVVRDGCALPGVFGQGFCGHGDGWMGDAGQYWCLYLGVGVSLGFPVSGPSFSGPESFFWGVVVVALVWGWLVGVAWAVWGVGLSFLVGRLGPIV